MTAGGNQPEIAVAGVICLDIIPAIGELKDEPAAMFAPGKLTTIEPAVTSAGGVVSNTGVALHRLGLPVRLMGKVGDDLFGGAVLEFLRGHGRRLADDMTVSPGEQTSYTLVFSPPGLDRWFMHWPGTSRTFGAADIRYDRLEGASLFHFGYPPLMPRLYRSGGAELVEMFERVKRMGLTTSMDTVMLDPASEAAGVDWPGVLARTLPLVDVFLPSLDEILLMLEPDRLRQLRTGQGGLNSHVDGALLSHVAQRLLAMGSAVVVLKLGDQGLYLRTTADGDRLAKCGLARPADLDDWRGRELLCPCFKVNVVGTTGSGDCAIAGFLAGLVKGLDVEGTLTAGVAAGACNVEQADAVSGIIPWDAAHRRIAAGWPRLDTRISLPGWRKNETSGLWIGPANTKR